MQITDKIISEIRESLEGPKQDHVETQYLMAIKKAEIEGDNDHANELAHDLGLYRKFYKWIL